jgi:hypothetical protein
MAIQGHPRCSRILFEEGVVTRSEQQKIDAFDAQLRAAGNGAPADAQGISAAFLRAMRDLQLAQR